MGIALDALTWERLCGHHPRSNPQGGYWGAPLTDPLSADDGCNPSHMLVELPSCELCKSTSWADLVREVCDQSVALIPLPYSSGGPHSEHFPQLLSFESLRRSQAFPFLCGCRDEALAPMAMLHIVVLTEEIQTV